MSTKEEESLIKSGFQSILQAFESQANNFNKEKEKYESFISSLQSENEQLKEENEKLKSDNIIITQESNQLKTKIDSLSSELQTKQDKIQMIKQSIEDGNLYRNQYYPNYNPPKIKKLFSNLYNNYTSNLMTEQLHNSSFNYNSNSANNSVSSKKAIDLSYKNDKFNNIQQRINGLKANTSVPRKPYKKIDVFDLNCSVYNNNTQGINSNRIDNRNVNYNNYSDRALGNKSKQYEMSNKFLNECRIALSPKIFNQMTILFQDHREGKKDDREMSMEVKKILNDNSRLLHLFDIIFQSD